MTDAEARKAVLEEYRRKYGDNQNLVVETLVRSPGGTILAVVKGAIATHGKFDEISLVTKSGDVRIFDGTGDLASSLANLNSERLSPFSPTVVSAIAFLVTLLAVIAFTAFGGKSPEGLQALTGILGLAAGFFFGNQATKH